MSKSWRPQAGMALAVLATLVALVLGTQDWYRQPASGGRMFSGDALWAGLTRNVAFAGLAAVLLMLVFGPTGRRVLAFLLGLLGAGMLWLGAMPPLPSLGGADEELGPGRRASTGAVLTGASHGYAAMGALLAVAAVWLLIYPGGHRERVAAVADDGTPRTAGQQWALMDRGVDPTEDL